MLRDEGSINISISEVLRYKETQIRQDYKTKMLEAQILGVCVPQYQE